MSRSFGNLFSSFGKKSNFTNQSNVTHLEKRGGNVHAIMQNGGTVNTGYSSSKVTDIHNGSGASTIIMEGGTRISYDHNTGQTRQV